MSKPIPQNVDHSIYYYYYYNYTFGFCLTRPLFLDYSRLGRSPKVFQREPFWDCLCEIFLQAGCSSCHIINSVTVLKEGRPGWQRNYKYAISSVDVCVGYLESTEDAPARVFAVDGVSARVVVELTKATPKRVHVPQHLHINTHLSVTVSLPRRRLQLRFDCDSTAVRLPIDCNSTALRPFDHLRHEQYLCVGCCSQV